MWPAWIWDYSTPEPFGDSALDIAAWYTVFVLIAVIAALISNRMGMDVAMLGGLALLMIGGVVSPVEATSGFASPAVLMLGGLFIIAAGLERTGAIGRFARQLLGKPTTVAGAQLRLMIPVSLLSAFMNNTPIVAICIPIVRAWSRRMRMSVSHLMMPLSFAAILGGKLTLIGTASNIIVMEAWVDWFKTPDAQWAHAAGIDAPSPLMQFIGVAGIGLPCLIIGMIFIVLAAPKLLPMRKPAEVEPLDAKKFQVELVVAANSPVIGRSIEQAGLRQLPGLFLSGLERKGVAVPAVDPDFELAEGDRLAFVGILTSVLDLRRIKGLEPADQQSRKLETSLTTRTLVEAVVSANSSLVGKSVRQSDFRRVFGAVILAVHRQGSQIADKIGDIVLKPGDTLLLEAHLNFRQDWRDRDEFFLISEVGSGGPIRHALAPISLAIMGALVALLIFAPIDRVTAVWACALAMVLTRCATGTEARKSIQWNVLLVIAGALGIGKAMIATGLADRIGSVLSLLGNDLGMSALLAMIFLAGALLSQLITPYAAAALLFPVCMTVATQLGTDPTAIMFTLMVGVGCSFISPIGYQTNLMVYGPGGYRFLDYARLGGPLTVILAIVAALVAPLIY